MSPSKVYYLCQYFRFRYLWRIALRFLRGEGTVLYYLFPNGASKFAEKRKTLFSALAPRVSIQQFPLFVTEMHNGPHKPVVESGYIDGMYQIMDKLEETVLNAPDSLLNSLNNTMSAIRADLALWIKHSVAWPTFDTVLLIEMAAWLASSPESPVHGQKAGVVLDKKNYGMDLILEYARKKDLRVLVFDSAQQIKDNVIAAFFYQLINLLAKTAVSIRGRKDIKVDTGKICTFHDGHGNFTDFYDKRNYSLFWYPASGIPSDRIVIFSRKSQGIDRKEVERAKASGFTLLSCDGLIRKAHPSIPQNYCTLRAFGLFLRYTLESVRLFFRVRTKAAYEEWKLLSVLFFRLPYWEDFFTQHNIRIFFKPGSVFSEVDVAAKLSGSASISYQYSNHVKIDMGHQDNCDAFFIWGKAYENVYRHRHSAVKNFIQSGYIFDYTFDHLNKKAEFLRENFRSKGVDFIISVFDESLTPPQFIFGDKAQRNCKMLYRSLFEYAAQDPTVGLVIKPKKILNEGILKSSEQLSGLIDHLEKEGRLKFLDAGKFPAEAGKVSDLALGMVAESSAALECSFSGVPAVYYDSSGKIKDPKTDKIYGENTTVFNNINGIMDAIERYRNDKDALQGSGDLSFSLAAKDPFQDGKANQRIGFYIRTLLSNMGNGSTKDIAVKNATKAYMDNFGKNKSMQQGNGIFEELTIKGG